MHVNHAIPVACFMILFVDCAIGQSGLPFCNRLYHSAVVANNKLFVDGGELRTARSSRTLNHHII